MKPCFWKKCEYRFIMKEIFNKNQSNLAKKMEDKPSLNKWIDWKWQLKHSIINLDTFEKLTGINSSKEDRKHFNKTIKKFPMSINPYYLSLTDTVDYQSDPIFKQSFHDLSELKIKNPYFMGNEQIG